MAKAMREMRGQLKLVEVLIEVLDARIPVSSQNPDLQEMLKDKKRLVLLNKADLADSRATEAWVRFFREKGAIALPLDSRRNDLRAEIEKALKELCKDRIERDLKRGIRNRPIRCMVAGIPNVGKSTFINSFTRKVVAKAANRPGVTKQNQWIRLAKEVEILDTPGVLWPKFEDPEVGEHLAMIGSVKDSIYPMIELSLRLIECLEEKEKGFVLRRYGIDEEAGEAVSILGAIARYRIPMRKGGETDIDRVAQKLLEDFRSGALGRFTLELPEDNKNEA